MAKKQSGLENVFKRTEPAAAPPADNSDLDEGNIKPNGVGLREGEIRALDSMGAELGAAMDADPVARNALLRIAVRKFILDYRAGALTLDDLGAYFTKPEKPKPKLNL